MKQSGTVSKSLPLDSQKVAWVFYWSRKWEREKRERESGCLWTFINTNTNKVIDINNSIRRRRKRGAQNCMTEDRKTVSTNNTKQTLISPQYARNKWNSAIHTNNILNVYSTSSGICRSTSATLCFHGHASYAYSNVTSDTIRMAARQKRPRRLPQWRSQNWRHLSTVMTSQLTSFFTVTSQCPWFVQLSVPPGTWLSGMKVSDV